MFKRQAADGQFQTIDLATHTILSGDLVGRLFVAIKVYERSLSYAEGKPFDLMQSALYSIRYSLLQILLTLDSIVCVAMWAVT